MTIPLDASEDREFWDAWRSGPQFATPLYYGGHLERFPERHAAVVAAVARAAPGGVAIHCSAGRDRTGLVSMLLLALVGVPAELIAQDYVLSAERLRARSAAHREPDQTPAIEAYLRERGTTAERAIVELLAEIDVERQLARGGLRDEDRAALRDRLLGPRG